MSMYQLTPMEIEKAIVELIEVGLVPFVQSSPGQGKSSIIRQIASKFKLKVIDLRLSQCAPEDLMGLPMKTSDGKATFAPFRMFPLKGDPIPKGYSGWLLLLDEFNSATKMVQAAAYKLVLDRMSGQEELHDNVFMVCAGNLETDKAIVNRLSTAMQSRLVHLEMVTHLPSFRKNALKESYDSRVLGFLEFRPGMLNTFDPEHNDKTFSCSRTWEFVSKYIKGKAFEDIMPAVIAGMIGEGAAVEFLAFLKEFGKLPSYNTILGHPEDTAVPPEATTRYAVVSMLLDRINKTDFPQVVKYVKRLPSEVQVVFFRGCVHRDPTVRDELEYVRAVRDLADFLHGDEDEMAA